MIQDSDLPTSYETERRLLGALFLLPVAERDAAVKQISSVWFADQWNARVFNILVVNRRRDFGADMLAAIKAPDGPHDNSAWWLSQLFCDKTGDSTSGRPQLWKDYARTLERLYSLRIRILLLGEQLRDEINAARTETYSLRDSPVSDARTDGRATGKRR